jgi:hypothetical protein
MITAPISEAKAILSELIKEAQKGEVVVNHFRQEQKTRREVGSNSSSR